MAIASTADPDYRIDALREIERRLALCGKLEAVERAARRFVREGLVMNPDYVRIREWADKSADPYLNLCSALDAIEPLNTR